MALGRPRLFFREDVLLIAARRAQGLSWRVVGRSIGTSGGHVHDLLYGELPAPREPYVWDLLQGDRLLYQLFGKCQRDPPGSPAAAAGRRPGPGRRGELVRTSVNRKMDPESIHRRRLRRARSRRSETRGSRA